MRLSLEKFGLLLGFIGMVAFAGTLPARRLAVTALDPYFLSAATAVLAGAVALAVLLLTRRPPPARALLPSLLLAGFCSLGAYPVFTAVAMVTLPAAHGGVVLGIVPLATAATAAILGYERPGAGFWLTGVAGAAIVLAFVLRRSGTETIGAGDLLLLGAVIAGSINFTLYGRLTSSMPGWEVISWSATLMLPFAAIATLALWPADLSAVPHSAWAAFAYIGLVSQYTGFFLFNAAMAMSGIARVGQILLLQPFVTVALSVPINHERVDFETLLFAAAVVVTVGIGTRMRVLRR